MLAVLPFLVFLFLLLVKKASLLATSLITLAVVVVLNPVNLAVSFSNGFSVAGDILIIIFGAIFFLEILKSLGVINNIGFYLETFSTDYRVKVIMLAWFLENFIEGTAGFGTPAAVVAPLLVGLGLSPLKAVIIGLLGNSASVVFGAAGTPIRTGFAALGPVAAEVAVPAAAINCLGFIVPVFILWALVADRPDRKKEFLDGLPFAVFSGLAFVIPALVTVFLGQEFPSIMGAVIGAGLIFLVCRPVSPPKRNLPWVRDLMPYGLLIFFLILGKILFVSLNPGFAFLVTGMIVFLIWGRQKKIFTGSLLTAGKKVFEPFLVIAATASFTQIMLNAGQIIKIAENFQTYLLPFFAPAIGAFGAFITGSATVSNIMFGEILATAAQNLNLSIPLILALQLVGAAAGNMIALADILAAETIVGLRHEERKILKGVIIPCLIYVFLVGLVGLFFANQLSGNFIPSIFNQTEYKTG